MGEFASAQNFVFRRKLVPNDDKDNGDLITMTEIMCGVVCRSSIIRMSSDRKQDVGTKTVENERIQVGVLRALVDEAEERDFSTEDDEDDQVDNEVSEKSDDTNNAGSEAIVLIYQ